MGFLDAGEQTERIAQHAGASILSQNDNPPAIEMGLFQRDFIGAHRVLSHGAAPARAAATCPAFVPAEHRVAALQANRRKRPVPIPIVTTRMVQDKNEGKTFSRGWRVRIIDLTGKLHMVTSKQQFDVGLLLTYYLIGCHGYSILN